MKQKETIFSWLYKKMYHTDTAPYYCYYSVGTIVAKPLRKWLSAVVIPSIPFSNLRVSLYRMIGYKIGKNVFIGMRCYLDDMCYDLLTIEDNVTISYGVFMSCHGRKQEHNPITIRKNAYIGMNSSILARSGGGTTIGINAVIGACTLVNKDIPDGATAVGIPARIISKSE